MTDLITLPELKVYLGTQGAGTPAPTAADDDLLNSFIRAATPVIGNLTVVDYSVAVEGPITEVLAAGGVLSRYPVAAVTAVTTSGGADLAINAYQVELATGLVTPTYDGRFPAGTTVTYTPVADGVPENVKDATKALVAHWWRQRKGGSPTYAPNGETTFMAGMGYGVPNLVRDKLGPSLRAPHFA